MQLPSFPCLETERLILRAPCRADAPVYTAFYADAQASGFYGGPKRPDEAFRVLCSDIGHWVLAGHGKWMLVHKTGGTVLGGCGLVHPDGWPSAELTWWLLPEHRGAGYASEASMAVIDFGYRTLGWPVVETHFRDENAPARVLAERLGGTKTRRAGFPDGVDRDVYAFPQPAGVNAA